MKPTTGAPQPAALPIALLFAASLTWPSAAHALVPIELTSEKARIRLVTVAEGLEPEVLVSWAAGRRG